VFMQKFYFITYIAIQLAIGSYTRLYIRAHLHGEVPEDTCGCTANWLEMHTEEQTKHNVHYKYVHVLY